MRPPEGRILRSVVYEFGDCELDPRRLELRRSGETVGVQPKPLELLFYLVRNRQRAVAKQELLDALWPDTAVTENSLTRVVSLARLAIGEREGAASAIRTLPRMGYRFVAAVREAGDAAGMPVAATPPPPDETFVGRVDLLDALGRAWQRSTTGFGQIAVLQGDAGIGKTRLASEFAARATDAGALVAIGRCPGARGAPAFWPWIQILRQLVRDDDASALRSALGPGAAEIASLVPALRAPGDPDPSRGPVDEPERFLLCDGIALLFAHASRERPLVVVLDDLHWADPPSLFLLRHLAPALRTTRALLLATVRPSEYEPSEALAEALADLNRQEHCHLLRLEGFSEEEVTRFLATRGRSGAPAHFATQLHRRTAGNPLFLREAVAWLERTSLFDAAELGVTVEVEIPPGVRDVFRNRIARVSDACQKTLAVGALIGREFVVHLLAAALQRSRPEIVGLLDEAAANGLVSAVAERPGRFAFAHDLVREVLADALSAGERALLHQRIGLALEALYENDPEAPVAELAHHFHHAIAAGEEERALHYAALAADQANRVLAWEDAALQLERALHALEVIGGRGERRLELLLQLAEARLFAGSIPETHDAALRAAAAARAFGDEQALVRAALVYGGLALWAIPASPERRALLDEALGAVGPAPSRDRARVLARRIAERPGDGGLDLDHVRPLALEAIEIARGLGDPDVLVEALHAYHFVLQGPDHLEARAELAREMLPHGARLERSFAVRENLAADLLMRGDLAGCRREIAIAQEVAEASRHPAFVWLSTGTRASLALMAGELDRAESLARDALALGQRIANPNAVGLFIGHAHLLARERDRIADLAGTAASQAGGRMEWVGTYARVGFATIFAEVGMLDQARQAFRALWADGWDALPRRDEWLASLTELAKLCADLGEAEHAPALERLLAPYDGWHAVYQGPLLYLGPVSRALGHLAAVQGRTAEARDRLAQARSEAEAVVAPLWAARIERELAALGPAPPLPSAPRSKTGRTRAGSPARPRSLR